jgi:hypothetical protein
MYDIFPERAGPLQILLGSTTDNTNHTRDGACLRPRLEFLYPDHGCKVVCSPYADGSDGDKLSYRFILVPRCGRQPSYSKLQRLPVPAERHA